MPEGLLESARNYLDITWQDDAGDVKLSGILARGMAYLNSIAGAELDFTEEASPRALLFDYCRYVRSNALEEYMINFQRELIYLQNMEEIKAYE
jgi:hypothetical protein